MVIATSLIAFLTLIYVGTVIFSVCYVKRQLSESRLLREATVLKDAYDYVIRTHEFRRTLYGNESQIRAVQSAEDLEEMERHQPEVYAAIHEVANCYHYIGFLMKYGLITNKHAIFEEGGETIRRVFEIIRPAIEQERARISKETYKQYLEYLVEEIDKWQSGRH